MATACADPQAVAVAHTNLGAVDIAEQRFADALAHFAEAEPVFREGQILSTLLPLLANRGQVHQMRGAAANALAADEQITRLAAESEARYGRRFRMQDLDRAMASVRSGLLCVPTIVFSTASAP